MYSVVTSTLSPARTRGTSAKSDSYRTYAGPCTAVNVLRKIAHGPPASPTTIPASAVRCASLARSSTSAVATPLPSWIAAGQSAYRPRCSPETSSSPYFPASIHQVHPPSQWPRVGRPFTLHGQPTSQLHAITMRPLTFQAGVFSAVMSSAPSHPVVRDEGYEVRSRREQDPGDDERDPDGTAERRPPRKELLREDDRRGEHDPAEAHRPRDHENEHERPAAPKAVHAVIEPSRSAPAVPPRQCCMRKSAGVRQARRQAPFSGVN